MQSHNILLARDGTAKIADVGVARILTQACPGFAEPCMTDLFTCWSCAASLRHVLIATVHCCPMPAPAERSHTAASLPPCAGKPHAADMQAPDVQAYVSQLGEIAGTFAWAAPELLLGQRCSEKADIYAFGVVVWELATGERPQRGQLRDVL